MGPVEKTVDAITAELGSKCQLIVIVGQEQEAGEAITAQVSLQPSACMSKNDVFYKNFQNCCNSPAKE